MPYARILAALSVVLFATVAQAQSPTQPIHFHLVHGFVILAQGEIGGLDHLNILIDTGAVPSALSRRVAAQLGARGPSSDLSLPSGLIQAQYATVKDVRLNWVHKESLDMVILDLAAFEERLGTRIDAILGLDLFANDNFSIDYRDATIRPGLSGSSHHQAPAEILYVGAAPYWVLSVQCDGATTHVLLDTGADDVTLFANAVAHITRRGGQSQDNLFASASIKPASSATGQFILGDAIFAKQRHSVIPKPTGALGDLDGFLGPTALHIRRLEFDWQHRLLWWDDK
ncbi:MAG TPA: retropepsin-like aspartic protease [Candidatus Acidoferrum sp.]